MKHHARLRVERVGLPGHGRQERHRHPVVPLRVLALDADAQQVFVGGADAGQRPAPEIQKRLVERRGAQARAQLGVLGLDELAVLLQADHVLGKDAKDRRRDARGGVALDGVDVVVGHQFARALMLEVPRRSPIAQLTGLHRVVAVVPLLIERKRRVRLVANARLDGHVVHALGDVSRGRIGGQGPAGLVEVARLRHGGRGLGHQLERALEVVVAVRRLVDLVGVGRLVAPVRSGRVEVAGRAARHRRIQRVGSTRALGLRVVVAARQQQHAQHAGDQPPHPTPRPWRRAGMTAGAVLHHQPSSASRPCTSSSTRAPTGIVTLVGTWPNGKPVRMGVFVTLRRCATMDLSV